MKAIYDTPLPDSWSEAPLSKVVVTRRGYTWEKADEVDRAEADTIPVIRIPNVQDTLDLTDLIHLRNVSPEALEKAAVTKDWLLFVGSNGTQDRIGDSVLIEEDRPMVFASFLMGIQPKDQGCLRSDFFAHWMRLHLVHEIFSKTSQQTTGLANFSWGAVKKLPVRFPVCIDEQRRIATALKLADDAIQKAREELQAARDLKSSLVAQLLQERSEKWSKTRFSGLLAEPIRNGYSPVCPQDPTGAWVLGLDALTETGFNPDGVKPAPVGDEGLLPFRLEADDILISRSNTPELVGRVGRYTGQPEHAYYPDLMMRIRVNHDQVSPQFAELVLQSISGRKWIKSRASGTSGSMVKIKRRDIMCMPVWLPERAEQDRIVSMVSAAKNAVNASEEKLAALQMVKKSLLHNLLTGKIRIPEGVIHD